MKLKKIVVTALTAIMLLSVCACEKGNMIDNYYNYDASQYIKLGQYENIVIEHTGLTATEDEINAQIDKLCNQLATWSETDRKEVQKGDKITITYDGYLKGTSYDGMSEENVEFEVGSGTYYEDFENELIGKLINERPNDSYRLDIDFPDDYYSGGIAGKTVTYFVQILAIKEKHVPELTDEIVKENTEGKYTTVEDYREFIAKTITDKKQAKFDDSFASAVWSTVISNAEIISYPEERMAYYEDELTSYLKSAWKQSDKSDFEIFILSYLGITYEDYAEQVKTKCETLVKEELVMLAIAREQNMTLEWDEYKKRARNYLEIYDCTSIAKLEKVVPRSELCLSILNEDIQDIILQTATSRVKQ